MKHILQRYASISGQLVNFNKSAATFSSNMKLEDRVMVCEKLGVQEGSDPGKYLCMPMRIGKNKQSIFSFLVDRVEQKLQTWSVQSISKAGKITLLKTVAQSIPNFWMNPLLIPADICDKIEKRMNTYWWVGGGGNRGIRWMSWERLCEIKEVGGLGFRKLSEFNIAMLAKQAWRLINNVNLLVTAVMKARYYTHTDFLNATLGAKPSYMWRSILASQEAILQGCRKKIGNGYDTNMWRTPWLPCEINGFLTSPMISELENTTVSGLISDDHSSWDMEVVNELCNERDAELIQQIPLPRGHRPDSWYWLWDEKGEFTVKICYRRIRGESRGQENGFWRKLWQLQLPGKMVNFLWKACQNVLPTAVELVRKQVNVSSLCTWCHNHVEDATHVLFTCSFARALWVEVGLQELSSIVAGMFVKDVLKREFRDSTREKCVKIGLFCWGLWTRSNAWVWDKKPMSVFGVKSMVLSVFQEWHQSQEGVGKGIVGAQKLHRKWCKPPEGWIKINLDAACSSQLGEIGVACVVRNDSGDFLRAMSNRFRGSTRAREAEALCLRETLEWIKGWRNQRCIFELDSKLVVDAIHGDQGNSVFHTIIDDCVSLLKHFREVLVVFKYRSANTVAHLLARAAFSMPGLMELYHTAPEIIHCNLISDAK